MATLLSTPGCPLATVPTTSRIRGLLSQQSSYSITGGPMFAGLKNIPKLQISKAANGSSTRSSCFKMTVSCSIAKLETMETVQSIIAKQLSIDASSVAPETKFADLGADSLDTVEIMMSLEEQFGVSIGEGGAENIATVQDAADLIEKVKAAAG